jgi:hypothetical protein
MTERDQLAGPVVGGSAGLHADEAGWQCAEVVEHLSATQLHLRKRATICVGRVHLKDLLGDVETDDADLHRTAPVGLPALTAIMARPCHGAGAVHPINGKLQDECLKREIFYSLREAQVVIGAWRDHYNRVRPHSALGYRPPAPVSLEVVARHLPTPALMQ